MYLEERDELAHARGKSRHLLAVVSLSFGVGETNCLQGSKTPVKNAFRLSAGTGNDKMKTVQHNRPFLSWRLKLRGVYTWAKPVGTSSRSISFLR